MPNDDAFNWFSGTLGSGSVPRFEQGMAKWHARIACIYRPLMSCSVPESTCDTHIHFGIQGSKTWCRADDLLSHVSQNALDLAPLSGQTKGTRARGFVGKVLCLARSFSVAENSSKPTINPDGPIKPPSPLSLPKYRTRFRRWLLTRQTARMRQAKRGHLYRLH